MRFFSVVKEQVRCPRCGKAMVPAIAMRGNYSQDWLRCSDPDCRTFYDTFIPMPHQYNILRDSHPRVGVFGGYGCGKTTADYKGDEKHIMLTPNGETLIGADTLIQLDNTIKKDLEGDFPLEFVKHYNRQRGQVTFINGHILYYRPLEDVGDIKSYNLTRAHILEASEVKREAYVQLQTRIRNEHAMKIRRNPDGSKRFIYDKLSHSYRLDIDYDWLQMVIESNPDSGWIKSDVLLKSDEITVYNESQEYAVPPQFALKQISSHVIPTRANYNLPPHFYEDVAADKPQWWISKFLEGSFAYSEGLVYPNHAKAIIEPFDIPKHWPVMIGFDYGLNDNSHFIFIALDFNGEHDGRPRGYVFLELVRNNMNVASLAQAYKEQYRRVIPAGGLYKTPVMDAKSYNQRTPQKIKLGDLFADEGCVFNPAQMEKDPRILRTNTFIDLGYLQIFNCCPVLIGELGTYKYPERTLERVKDISKPVDGNDHGISALEFAVMELPNRMQNRATQIEPVKAVLKSIPQYDPFYDTHAGDENSYEGFAAAFRGY